MNDIDSLTDHEKSKLLAKLIGWEVSDLGQIFPEEFPGSDVAIHSEDSLFNPRHMALAWQCLNYFEALDMSAPSLNWRLFEYPLRTLACESPAVAQRLWLDKILSLAIEAGIVELEEENR